MFREIAKRDITQRELLRILKEEKDLLRLNTKRQSVLFYPNILKHPQAIQVALSRGVDPNLRDQDGVSALEMAIYYGYGHAADLLITKGAATDFNRGYTPLIVSVIGEEKGMVRKFLNREMVNRADEDSWTPLFWAVQQENIPIIRLLLNAGADSNHMDNTGRTPLFDPCGDGNEKVFDLLMHYGASVNVTDNQGTTPLELAVAWGHYPIVAKLLEAGALFDDTKDGEGMTLLDYAKPHEAILALLEKSRVKNESKTKF